MRCLRKEFTGLRFLDLFQRSEDLGQENTNLISSEASSFTLELFVFLFMPFGLGYGFF